MNKPAILLAFCALTGLTGCLFTVGDKGNDQTGPESRHIDQDISATRDSGPTSGNLEEPGSNRTEGTVTTTTTRDASPPADSGDSPPHTP
jgi:hypothetical protein